MTDTNPTPVDSEHVWIRTVPTDGRWCYHCAIAEAQWNGEPCDGEGGIIRLEQQLIDCRAELRSARAAIPGPDTITVNRETAERAERAAFRACYFDTANELRAALSQPHPEEQT